MKKSFEKAKSQQKSKRKFLFLSFITVLNIFGVTLLTGISIGYRKRYSKKYTNTLILSEVYPSSPLNLLVIVAKL